MKLVINIDEKTIDAIKHEDFFINLGRNNGKTILCNIINAIETATPLKTYTNVSVVLDIDSDAISRKDAVNEIARTFYIPKPRVEACLSMLMPVNPTRPRAIDDVLSQI